MYIPSDEFDGSEGFVHVPKSRVEAEVRHGPESGRFTGLETNIVFHGEPGCCCQLMMGGGQ